MITALRTCPVLAQQQQQVQVAQVVREQEAGAVGVHCAIGLREAREGMGRAVVVAVKQTGRCSESRRGEPLASAAS